MDAADAVVAPRLRYAQRYSGAWLQSLASRDGSRSRPDRGGCGSAGARTTKEALLVGRCDLPAAHRDPRRGAGGAGFPLHHDLRTRRDGRGPN